MGSYGNISQRDKLNADVIRQDFLQVLSALESKEKHLKAIQESVAESSKVLNGMRESIEARLKEVEDKEKDFHLFQANSIRDLELKNEELSLIRKDVMVRQEKLNEQEKRTEELFEEIKKEGKQFETTRKLIDEKFVEILSKEKQINLTKKQIDSRANELHEREQSLDRRQKEIELREVVLATKNDELKAKEKGLDAREKILNLNKELDTNKRSKGEFVLASKNEKLKAKENGLDAREKILDLKKEVDTMKKFKGECSSKPDLPNPTPAWDLRMKSRKILMNSVGKYRETSDADCSNPSKRCCHVKGSSNSTRQGGNSAHSHSDSTSSSGDTSSSEVGNSAHSHLDSTSSDASSSDEIIVCSHSCGRGRGRGR